MASSAKAKAWLADQIAKSEYFHDKLHEWGLVETAEKIDQVKGENLDWNTAVLEISEEAWNKVIHRGIKPVIVFVHPQVLQDIPRSLGYYRMLAMVSQKSMSNIKLRSQAYEVGKVIESEVAEAMARRLNKIISMLIEADEQLDAREFDIWRGMAAGAQAQGSWNPNKGKLVEEVIKNILRRRLRDQNWISGDGEQESQMVLSDKRKVEFASEPDAAIYNEKGKIVAAVEIKGGIDSAGVLERVGAAIKSLSRAKKENPAAVTILILQGVSVTPQAETYLSAHQDSVNYWLTIEDFLENEDKRDTVFKYLQI